MLDTWHTQPSSLYGSWSRPAFSHGSQSSCTCLQAGKISCFLDCALTCDVFQPAISKGFSKIPARIKAGVSTAFRYLENQSVSGLSGSAVLYCRPHVARHCPLTSEAVDVTPGHAGWPTNLQVWQLQVDLISLYRAVQLQMYLLCQRPTTWLGIRMTSYVGNNGYS